jgi:aryl-alcohol dehydrogenase-like predicted oxidoreductase
VRQQERRQVGRSAVWVPPIGFGTSGLGGMPATYGYDVEEERALATVRAVLAHPDGFIDSSRNYGFGRSEERIGRVVRDLGGWPEGRVLSTKLDRDMETGRFDAARARPRRDPAPARPRVCGGPVGGRLGARRALPHPRRGNGRRGRARRRAHRGDDAAARGLGR